MFNKVLIANRGEIAVRIIRACREMGIRTVAVYSTADKNALHVQLANEAVCIGPAATKDSYLNIPAILSACSITNAEAIHPGFGFLSESSKFCQACEKCGIKFIGPRHESIDLMGDKAEAKATMKRAGVPVIPGSDGELESVEQAKEIAREIGYPVMVKASAGGGGRGIRYVAKEEDLEEAMATAAEEAKNFFGNPGLYLEKFIVNPRHVEVQLLADSHGNVIHLGERDCSVQRRHQKVLEESPCPVMTPELREKMGNAAVLAAKASGYENAGTVEFLLDVNNDFYFMEMNTRIQVEHPVTETVTGVDIVKEQIRIAAGLPLAFRQEDIHVTGHAIECRINAENPKMGFLPSPGRITALNLPGGPGVRIDSAAYQGCEISPYYDSMIAKLIVHAHNRDSAIRKMKSALAEFLVEGVDTNIDYHLAILRDEAFVEGRIDNSYLDRRKDLLDY